MTFELSRDYARAWQLIQQGEKLAVLRDALYANCRDVEIAYKGLACLFFMEFEDWEEYASSDPFEFFVQRCTERNAEFYLPLADNMIVISEERLREMLGEAIDKALAPMDKMIKTMGEITL